MPYLLTRRSLLRRSAGAAAFVTGLSAFQPLFAAPATRRFKIGACDWSLGKRSDPAALDLARQIGLDGVQIDFGTGSVAKPEVQRAYREAIQRTGLEVASVALGELNSVPLKSDPRAAKWLAESIDLCQAMNLPITMPAFFGKGDLDMTRTAEIEHVVEVLKQLAPQAKKQGVVIGLENYLSADDNRKLIDRVGSPAVKVYYDVGNSTDKGRDVLKEIRGLGKLICEFHAKDGHYMLGEAGSRIDFRQVRKAMDDIQYSGWIHIEAAHPHGIVADYTADGKYLKGIFQGGT